MKEIKEIFEKILAGLGLEIIMVYEAERKEVVSISARETLQRRGAEKK